MLRRRIVTEVVVEKPLYAGDYGRERWFRRNKRDEIWRLIRPESINDGQFTKVTE
jgi:hypothetical protein